MKKLVIDIIVRTEAEIEAITLQVGGGHVKRNNTRKHLSALSNEIINNKIEEVKELIRLRKAEGFKQQDLRLLFADISELSCKLL